MEYSQLCFFYDEVAGEVDVEGKEMEEAPTS